MNTINLEVEVIRENNRVLEKEAVTLAEQTKLDAEVAKVLETADARYNEGIMSELGFDYKLAEALKVQKVRTDFAHLPQNRIMSADAIKAVCIKHGLRFLPTRFYKGALDAGIGPKLEEFRNLCGGKLPTCGVDEMVQDGMARPVSGGTVQFYIAAPKESFALQPRAMDPLLFCRLTPDKFFLLHKWGRDLEKNGQPSRTHELNWNSVMDEWDTSIQDLMKRQNLNFLLGASNNWMSSTASAMWTVGTSGTALGTGSNAVGNLTG